MGKEKKKQHYVPRCYLEQWSVPEKYQVFVYNKQQEKTYPASINDVASERYFYDFDFTDIITENDLAKYGVPDVNPRNADDGQYIENFFSLKIEEDLKNCLAGIINRVTHMSPWEIKNCYFLSMDDKLNFAVHLALQFVRVKSVRSSMADTADCLQQFLEDMGASSETKKRYSLSPSKLSCIHGKMILNHDRIQELTNSFVSLTWMLLVNRTSIPFFTSDSPIGTIEHIHHPFLCMAGLNCQGVEAFFPISPNLLLIMVDSDYHTTFQNHDRRIDELTSEEIVKFYNSWCVLRSDSCVFSNTNNFSIIDEMVLQQPDILNQPHSVFQWGTKTYTPRLKTK